MATKQPPSLASYRRLQIARHLIVKKGFGSSCMEFDNAGRISRFLLPLGELEAIISDGRAFATSGCPDCNRPYYNERVSGPVFNYPREPNAKERSTIWRELVGAIEGY